MTKSMVGIVCFIILSGCSGYLGQDDTAGKNGAASFLVLADGSGDLSTDQYNEITPFLYRTGGNSWLVYASDKDGSYDIYLAKMHDDGKFESPQKMNSFVNTGNSEFSPVVFKAPDSANNTNTYISFIRATNFATNVYSVPLDNNMNAVSSGSASSLNGGDNLASGLGLAHGEQVPPVLLVSTNSPVIMTAGWDVFTLQWGSAGSKTFSGAANIRSCSEWVYPDYGSYGFVYFYDNNSSGRYQIYGAYEGTLSNAMSLDLYKSTNNDRDPFVDQPTKKVYFASDRNGLGNYDLYRYNTQTANLAVPGGLSLTVIPAIDSISLSSYGSMVYVNFYYNSDTSLIQGFRIYRRDISTGEIFPIEIQRIPVTLNNYYGFYDYNVIVGHEYEYTIRPYYMDAQGPVMSDRVIASDIAS